MIPMFDLSDGVKKCHMRYDYFALINNIISANQLICNELNGNCPNYSIFLAL